jgi:hypothetical protein
MTEGTGERFRIAVFASLNCLCAVIDPVIDESCNASTLRDGGALTLVPGAGILKGEVDPFDGGGVRGLGATREIPSVDVCEVSCMLYQRDRGLDDRETVVGDDPLGVLQYICQELPNRDVEGGNVGRVAGGGAGGGKGVGENIAVFEVCAVGEGFASVSVRRDPGDVERVRRCPADVVDEMI